MHQPIVFPGPMETLVRFVEETPSAEILPRTLEKLRAGTSIGTLLTASSLAVVRSTELPPQHHGGPVHPICGVRAVHEIARRLPGELAYLPVLQHVTLTNNHVSSPLMGPFVMPAMAPIAGTPQAFGTYHMSDEAFHGDPVPSATETLASDPIEMTKDAFTRTLHTRQAPAAEHHFLWLLERLSPGEALDQLLPLALSGNGLDDHNFLYPVYTARALDCLGWEWAPTLFRPAVRYQARSRQGLRVRSRYEHEEIEALVDEYRLLERNIPLESTPSESKAIAELAQALGGAQDYSDNVERMAQALSDGLSLAGAGEALSVGAALAYLSTSYGNPMDSHLHTGANNRRYLLGVDGVGLRHKVVGLLTGFTGPEVILAEGLLNWSDNIDAEITKDLPGLDQAALLDALSESIEAQPWIDWRTIGVSNVIAPDDVKRSIALARQYADLGFSPDAYFERLAEISCRDDFTEMHAFKHFQAIVEEYYATRPELRWVHMVSAAKSAAVVHVGREHRIYQQARELLAA